MSRIDDVLMSIGGVLMLVLIVVAIDPRVRESAGKFASAGQTPPEVGQVTHHARELLWFFAGVVRDQTSEHSAFFVFGIAAIVLVMFMLRT